MNAYEQFMVEQIEMIFPSWAKFLMSQLILPLIRKEIIPFYVIEKIIVHNPFFDGYEFAGNRAKGHDLVNPVTGHKIEIKAITSAISVYNNYGQRNRIIIGNMINKDSDLLVFGHDRRLDKMRFFAFKASEYNFGKKNKMIDLAYDTYGNEKWRETKNLNEFSSLEMAINYLKTGSRVPEKIFNNCYDVLEV